MPRHEHRQAVLAPAVEDGYGAVRCVSDRVARVDERPPARRIPNTHSPARPPPPLFFSSLTFGVDGPRVQELVHADLQELQQLPQRLRHGLARLAAAPGARPHATAVCAGGVCESVVAWCEGIGDPLLAVRRTAARQPLRRP